MKNLFLRALLISLIASNSMAANLISTASGFLSPSTTWSLGGAYAFPESYTSTNNLSATNATERYTAPFTSVAGSTTTGVILWVYVPSVASTNFWVQLYDGTTLVAGSTVTFQISSGTTVAPCHGPFFFKFGTPYLHTGATLCKFGARSASATAVAFRYSTSTTLAYLQVRADAQAPAATGDSLFIVGGGTAAGTINSYVVTVDTSISVGNVNASTEAIQVGAGGTLTWGTSQSDSYTITSSNTIRIFSSYPGANGFEMGTSATPLSTTSVQSLIFAAGATSKGLTTASGNSINNNYHPPSISIHGNYAFNQASQALYKTSASATSEIGWTTMTFTDDLGLRVGGGDLICVGASESAVQNETLTSSAYNSATKQVTFSTPFAYKHSTGTWVWNLTSNAVIKSTSSVTATFISCSGYATNSLSKPHVAIENLEMQYISQLALNVTDASSYVRYVRSRNSLPAGTSPMFYMPFGTISNSIYQSAANMIAGLSNLTRVDAIFTAANKYVSVLGASLIWDGGIIDSGYIYFSGASSGCRFTDIQQYGAGAAIYSNSNNYESYFYNFEEGRPIKNTYAVGWNSALNTIMTLVNPIFNSDTTVRDDMLALDYADCQLRVQNADAVAGQGILYKTEGTIETSGAGMTDSTTRTVGRLAIKLTPRNDMTLSTENLYYKIMKAVPANQGVTVSCYMQRNASYGQVLAEQPQITLESSDGAINQTVSMSTTTAASTWELILVGGQMGTTEGGYVTITVKTPTTTSGAVAYVADMFTYVGPPSEGWANGYGCSEIWREGRPSCDFSGGVSVQSDFLKTIISQSTAAAVSGTVGSVTGNVGGNVTGSVGSVSNVSTIVTGYESSTMTVALATTTHQTMVYANASATTTASVSAADLIAGTTGGLVLQGYTTARAGYLDNINNAALQTMTDATIGTTTANQVWEELMSAHLTTGTYGQRLNAIYSGQAVSGAATSLTLDSGASATAQIYRNCVIFLTGGTGAGQARFITDYQGTSRLVTVPAWAVTPGATTKYVIIPMGDVSSAVWDALVNTYNNSGSFGNSAGLGGVRVNTVGTASIWSDTTAQAKIMLGVNSSTMTVAIATTTNATEAYAYTASTRPSVATSDIQAGCTAALTLQGYTTDRAGYLDNTNNVDLLNLSTSSVAIAAQDGVAAMTVGKATTTADGFFTSEYQTFEYIKIKP